MNWTKGPIIGRGSSATVSLATTATGGLFAVKSVKLSDSHFLQKEQRFLSRLNSPYVIEYIGFDVDYDNDIPMYNLLMEYAPGGTVSDVIKKNGGFLDECLIRSYTPQILLGLNYLHSNNLVHCDIKCQNILLVNDRVKIGDLGCTKLAENRGDLDDCVSSVFSGTPVFMAPEVARGEDQGFSADVWAVGCAVIEMATGCNPWPDVNDPVSALYRIGFSGDLPKFPMWLSVEGKDFLDKCLRRNVKERWTATQLLQHPFVNSNLGFEKMETFSKNSPSSILDHGFWDSLEVLEPSPVMTRFGNFSGESPVDRIRRLVKASPCVTSWLPNWDDEEDWISVRINHIDESIKISQWNLNQNVVFEDGHDDYSELTRVDSFLFLDLYVEEELSRFVRMVLESNNVFETNVPSVTNNDDSKFVNCKRNNNDDACLIQIHLSLSYVCMHVFSNGFEEFFVYKFD